MTHLPPSYQAFGVGKVLSDAFTVYRGSFVPVMTVLAIAGFISTILLLTITGATLETVPFENLGITDVFFVLISAILQNLAFGAAILIAYNWGHGRPMTVARALIVALTKVHLLIFLTFLWAVGVSVMMFFLLIPGIWLIGVWAALLPCIMIEERALSAFGRSAELTKGVRWPIIGSFVLMVLLVAVMSSVLSAIAGAISGDAFSGSLLSPGTLISLAHETLIGAAINGLIVAIIVSVYQRLIEIKEGGSSASLADVFE